MVRQEAPHWRRRPTLSVVARFAAFAIPLVAGAAAAAIVLVAFSDSAEGSRVAWWTSALVASVLVAMACLPLAHRVSALGLLLVLDVEFPSAPPSRWSVALRASTIKAIQQKLARSAPLEATDELVTTRMATASTLGMLRVIHIRGREFPQIVTTVVVAACIAFAAVAVIPDRAESPSAPSAPSALGGPLATPDTNGGTTGSTVSAPQTPIPIIDASAAGGDATPPSDEPTVAETAASEETTGTQAVFLNTPIAPPSSEPAAPAVTTPPPSPPPTDSGGVSAAEAPPGKGPWVGGTDGKPSSGYVPQAPSAPSAPSAPGAPDRVPSAPKIAALPPAPPAPAAPDVKSASPAS